MWLYMSVSLRDCSQGLVQVDRATSLEIRLSLEKDIGFLYHKDKVLNK